MSPVSSRSKRFWVVLALVAVVCFIAAWPLDEKYSLTAASPALRERTKQAVEKNPQLKPDWDKAMEDAMLTYPEAKAILEKRR
jgi:hypothetical protein